MKRRKKSIEEILKLEYVSLTELGTLFGTTSHIMGRALKRLGLWNPCDEPTIKAMVLGYVRPRGYSSECERTLNTWHRETTVAELQTAGWKLQPVSPPAANSRYIIPNIPKPSSPSKP
jgi:hypothetical protein